MCAALPADVRKQARDAYKLFMTNPNHPSLRYKQIKGAVYSVRIGLHYRALGVRQGEKSYGFGLVLMPITIS